MNEQASILFNMSSSFSGNSAGKIDISAQSSYLKRSICTLLARNYYKYEGFETLGRQLVAIARHAYFSRQMETVEQASQWMLALPLSSELKLVAQYYQAICAWKQGKAGAVNQIFSFALDKASPGYQGQGLLTVGATYFGQGKFEMALPYYLNAAQASREHDLLVFAASQKMIAVVRSIYGDHHQALAELERLFPTVRVIATHYPSVYYEFLNSYAVELGEVGRIIEAQQVCNVVLRSPFVESNPQFAQTRDELAAKRTAATPSVVAVAALPEVIPSPQAEAEPQPAHNRSTIALKLERLCSPTRALTRKKTRSIATGIRVRTILDQLAYSISPRSPPALL